MEPPNGWRREPEDVKGHRKRASPGERVRRLERQRNGSINLTPPHFSMFLNDSRDGLSFLTELRLRVDRATGRHLGANSEELGAPASSQCTGGREPL